MSLFSLKKQAKSEENASFEAFSEEKKPQKIQYLNEFTDFIQYLHSPRRIFWHNLIAGIFRGIGGFLGLTVGVALLIWLLQTVVQFDFPLINSYIERLLNILEKSTSITP